jgi:cobalt/nickel transport system permease protein
MADALISPEVGGSMWAISGGALLWSSRKLKNGFDDFKVPLMGVMGAFIFAAQMINFSIPGTGSSGHICGSLLLAVLLGPYAALVVISSVLLVQALIFADGGLLALGCNIFNMGVIPALIAYPVIYSPIAGKTSSAPRLWFGSVTASVIGLQLGASGVVTETWISGVSELPFNNFILLMLPIHLAIGFIEGIITASVLTFIKNLRPQLVSPLPPNSLIPQKRVSLKTTLAIISIAALVIAGGISWFASENPDGLEWASERVTKGRELKVPENSIHTASEEIQKRIAFLPDYSFKSDKNASNRISALPENINIATTISGITGALLTLILALTFGFALKYRYNHQKTVKQSG